MDPFRGLKPVETAFRVDQIPLLPDGSLSHEIADALEMIPTPPKHLYGITVRFINGGYSPDTSQIVEGYPDKKPVKPVNVKRAIEIAIQRAKENDARASEGFRSVDVQCFPFEWNWGKNQGEYIFKDRNYGQ